MRAVLLVALAACTSADVAGPPRDSPPPADGCIRHVAVNTVGQLTAALRAAVPGDCIDVAAGTYTLSANLVFNRSGSAQVPITLQGDGSEGTIVDGNGVQILLRASYLRIRKLRFTNLGVQGLWLQGVTYSVFDSLEIDHTKQAAFAFKDASHHNVIQNSWLHDTGTLISYFGEAIYVGNSGDANFPLQFTNTDNQILHNHFGPNVRSQAIDIKEGSDRTVVRGNYVDGTGTEDVPSQGSSTLIQSYASYGVFDSNYVQYGSPSALVFYAPSTTTMVGNLVTNNTVDLENTHNVDFNVRPFYAFYLTADTDQGGRVVIQCNNTVTNGALSNIDCTP